MKKFIKVLIVCSGNREIISPFVLDQANDLVKKNVMTDFFIVKGKGLFGYLKNLQKLKFKIADFKPDIIHAHYGLCGLLAGIQRKVPVVVTYHGSDIDIPRVRKWSKIAIRLSKENIFVSYRLAKISKVSDYHIIPCGVNLELFKPIDKLIAREKLGLSHSKKYILFSSWFENPVKNSQLAIKTIDLLNHPDIELIELKDFTREQVALLMNSADAALMTSFSEGSPQFIKEAMACNTPIVSVDVGEVRKIINNAENCFIVSNPEQNELASCLKEIINSGRRSNGRQFIHSYDSRIISNKIVELYKVIIGEKNT